jgi:hypothetical protein
VPRGISTEHLAPGDSSAWANVRPQEYWQTQEPTMPEIVGLIGGDNTRQRLLFYLSTLHQ